MGNLVCVQTGAWKSIIAFLKGCVSVKTSLVLLDKNTILQL